MTCVSFHLAFYTRCSTNKKGWEKNKQKLNGVKINGTKSFSPSNVDLLSQNGFAITSVDSEANVYVIKEQFQ